MTRSTGTLIDRLLSSWDSDPQTSPNFTTRQVLPLHRPELHPIPPDFPAPLLAMLNDQGIFELFSHQVETWHAVLAGGNIVLATGTASGKTLGYTLPVLASMISDDLVRALYLFPTKALAQDQLSALERFQVNREGASKIPSAIYDGDTPSSQRLAIRRKARIIFTNPDMLHTGILPHHTIWEPFFRGLHFVVIDEMHSYRGVFGSHVANVIRRLKRICSFYGAKPQFLLTSATIGNPAELGERLIEEPVQLIDQDGSGQGPRYFYIYNPPLVDPSLGLRKNATHESIRLARGLWEAGLQSVVFARSRRGVEIILKQLQEIIHQDRRGGNGSQVIRGYRSGYLPSQRRVIEKGLRDGSVRLVVATNALELGIDIGGLGAAILVGYPGTVASTRQQAGRAGRGLDPALAILVVTSNPLDQFLARHPEYLLHRSPEQALINPDHLMILLNHLRCAAFELPFRNMEGFGGLTSEQLQEYLEFLVNSGEMHPSRGDYYWMADAYPAATVSLRSASPDAVVLHVEDNNGPRVIGEVDLGSALWMAHPHAVYLHEGQQHYVQDLNLERKTAALCPVNLDYFTEPLRTTNIQVMGISAQERTPGGEKTWGELRVTTQVTGFRKRSWINGENLGQESLDLPAQDLPTTGYWLSISNETIEALQQEGLWTNAPNDYGPDWKKIRDRIRARDGYRCQGCGRSELGREHDIHHRIPFRFFQDENGRIDRERANQPGNLITLCPDCHRIVERSVRVRSGLAGLAYTLSNLAPLFLMCDPSDLGQHIETQDCSAFNLPSVVLYDMVPAGIGFSQKLYELHADLLQHALELVSGCSCEDGCPSCIGPGGENGMGGKVETLEIIKALVK